MNQEEAKKLKPEELAVRLYVLVELMDNYINNNKNIEFRHYAKSVFTPIIRDVKRLNRVIGTLENIESFDNTVNHIAKKINEGFNELNNIENGL